MQMFAVFTRETCPVSPVSVRVSTYSMDIMLHTNGFY